MVPADWFGVRHQATRGLLVRLPFPGHGSIVAHLYRYADTAAERDLAVIEALLERTAP